MLSISEVFCLKSKCSLFFFRVSYAKAFIFTAPPCFFLFIETFFSTLKVVQKVEKKCSTNKKQWHQEWFTLTRFQWAHFYCVHSPIFLQFKCSCMHHSTAGSFFSSSSLCTDSNSKVTRNVMQQPSSPHMMHTRQRIN